MSKINNIIIFVGGRGTRLGDITKKTPKPLITFKNIEFIYYQINLLLKLLPKQIILLCGYKKQQFKKKFHNKIYKGIRIKCLFEKKLLGTGGSLANAKKYIVNNTLVCNGDTYFDYDFQRLNKIKFDKLLLILVKNKIYKSNKKLANLGINNGKIIYKNQSKLMNSGYYIINRKIIKHLKKGFNSFEDVILKNLIINKQINGIKSYNNVHIDIGTKKNLKIFKKLIR